jgi:hypothetical protein
MKKMISFFSSIGVVAVGASGVTSCSNIKEQNITIDLAEISQFMKDGDIELIEKAIITKTDISYYLGITFVGIFDNEDDMIYASDYVNKHSEIEMDKDNDERYNSIHTSNVTELVKGEYFYYIDSFAYPDHHVKLRGALDIK